jgi:hypothetical protein
MDRRTDISKLIGGFAGFAKAPVSHMPFSYCLRRFMYYRKHVQTHSEFSVSSNAFWQIFPLFGGVSAGCIRMRIVTLFVH